MEPNIIAKYDGLTVICGGHAIVIHDAQGKPGYSVGVLFDKVVFEELQVMCRLAIRTVADMGSDRAYTAAVSLARLFGGDVQEVTLQLGGYMPGETETRQ